MDFAKEADRMKVVEDSELGISKFIINVVDDLHVTARIERARKVSSLMGLCLMPKDGRWSLPKEAMSIVRELDKMRQSSFENTKPHIDWEPSQDDLILDILIIQLRKIPEPVPRLCVAFELLHEMDHILEAVRNDFLESYFAQVSGV